MSENNVNGINGADVATTTGIIGATIAIGQYIVNDYVITIAEAQGDYGYTMTITRGTETQTVTLYGLTQEQYDAMLGYLEQAQAAAQSAAASSGTASDAAVRAETAAGQITGMTAEAVTLAPGSAATVSFLDGLLTLGIPAGETGATGAKGDPGPAGETGNGIVSIIKTGTQGNVDTYTITMTDGSTSTFTVTNGTDGAVLSVAGKTGAVTLDAGDVEYDDTDTYAAGSVGAGLADLKSQIEEISQTGIDASGASDGQVPVADGQGSWAWDDPAGGGVSDVQVNGVSVVSDGVANVQVGNGLRLANNSTRAIMIQEPNTGNIRTRSSACVLTPSVQDLSVFYGLAWVAGDTTQAGVTGNIGNYTEAAKSAISEMLNGSVAVTGTTPSITALPGVRYVCGEVSTIDITVPATGIIDVVFTSGSTPAVLTVTPPTSMTMKWANGFDPTALDANTVYEINIMDGCYGVVGQWN